MKFKVTITPGTIAQPGRPVTVTVEAGRPGEAGDKALEIYRARGLPGPVDFRHVSECRLVR